ncbi:MAG: chitobiase/beta-hexosaminidase C-terminal domain-containing protein [Bacteroidales bacterium]|nr:chitobiase/beta-hexosaminidase C-terminal domain-containing protein [Bacteroidales bacterium]
MKQKLLNNFRLRALMLVALLCAAFAGAWADSKTFTFSELGLSNGVEYTDPFEKDNITVTFSAGSKYYNTGTAMRLYGGCSATFSANGSNITKVELTFASGNAPTSKDVWSTEGKTSVSNDYTTWYGSATSVSITRPSGSGHWRLQAVTITYETSGSGLAASNLALTGAPVALEFDLHTSAAAQTVYYTTSSTGAVTVGASDYVETSVDAEKKAITVTPLKKTSGAVEITVSQAADETYKAGSATFTVTIDDSTPKTGAWVATDLASLTEDDVFVIVGNNGSDYALPNDNGTGSAPSAVEVTVEDDELTSDVADNIKWNISGDAENGYTFYPDGSTTTWLYTTTNNNGVRVGDNENNAFKIVDNYLQNTATSRYVGVYNSQDWRCYTSNTGNIAGQTFTFYKYEDNAAVKTPVITVEESFVGSITATITCATEGATIYYSYDNVNWTEYTEALVITETTTIYAKAQKDEDVSSIAQATTTKTLATPTVTIDATGITNTNVYEGTDAGSLSASVTYNEAAVEGATVTWSGNADAVATINASTGAVTLVGAGSVTFTATYAGKEGEYNSASETYEMTVTNTDPNAPGTENNPYTVAQALENTPASGTSADVYVRGIVSRFYNTDVVKDYSNRYYISDDGTETDELLVYKGNGLDNVAFSSADDLQIGDIVVIKGGLTTFNSTKEFASGNYIVSLVRKAATPTFDPESGAVASGTEVTISTTTEGATIYYTTDGSEPTTESAVYEGAITITEALTIKAIAVNDGYTDSDVATAEYTISVEPYITVDTTPIEIASAGGEGTIEVTYNNFDEVTADIAFYEADGTTPAEYNWVVATINEQTNNVDYIVEANTGEARTAYLKVYALDAETNVVYSELITISQAKLVIDYATLPFSFNGGKDDIDNTTGLTANGLGSDYKSAPYLKFDGTGDYLVLKLNEAPGIIAFDIKGNGFSGGTFTVQTSADGESYTDLAIYTALGNSLFNEMLANTDATVRYIKWIYTSKSLGNVGLGNIKVSANGYTRTVTAGNFGTICLPYAVAADDYIGVTFYEIASKKTVDGDLQYITLAEVTEGLTAGVAYLFLADDKATQLVAAYSGDAVTEPIEAGDSGTGLTGTFESAYIPVGNFILKNGVIYYVDKANYVKSGANKAYIDLTDVDEEGEASVKGIRLYGEGFDATGISGVEAQGAQGKVYNIAGQRVSKTTKGLYIVNGKKVVIK